MARARRPARLDPSEKGWVARHGFIARLDALLIRGRLCMTDRCIKKATVAVAVRDEVSGRMHEVGICKGHLGGLDADPPTVAIETGFVVVNRRDLDADEILDGPAGSDEGG